MLGLVWLSLVRLGKVIGAHGLKIQESSDFCQYPWRGGGQVFPDKIARGSLILGFNVFLLISFFYLPGVSYVIPPFHLHPPHTPVCICG